MVKLGMLNLFLGKFLKIKNRRLIYLDLWLKRLFY